MFGFHKKLLSKDSGIRLEVPVPDFIPYACHYDENTILTRNGELLQVIKIIGFSHETVDGKQVELRDTIRKAVIDNIKTREFSLWFHTVRRKRSLDTEGTFDTPFCNDLHKAWTHKHYWHDKYVNELYVTIIHQGKAMGILRNPKQFLFSLSLKEVEHQHEMFLEESSKRLNKVVQGVLGTLEQYGAKRLSIVIGERGVYSELLQFFGKIIHLAEVEMPVPIINLSEYLANHRIAFGNSALEVRGATGKHFGAILTIKEYHELPNIAIDRFLQLPQQFVVTQTLNFISSKRAVTDYTFQDYVLTVSKDEKFHRLSGIQEMIASDTGSQTDYGEHQITIMLIEDDLRKLDHEVRRAVNELSELGVVTIREDLHIEDAFWSQLPANFSYICRKRPINTLRVAGFSSLHNFPVGRQFHNHWGEAITIFRTALGTPYFFNFHLEDNGHTVIIGPKGTGKTVLLNFFLSESRKFNTKLFFFDQYRAAKVFINAIGGQYMITSPTAIEPEYRFNPLLLPDNVENRLFLVEWLEYLCTAGNNPIDKGQERAIEEAVNKLYMLPKESRQLSSVVQLFGDETELSQPHSLRSRLSVWVGDGRYASLFDNPRETFNWDAPVWGTDVSQLLEDPTYLIGPVLSYYFHRVNMALDGTPAIIAIDEAWSLLDNAVMAPKLEKWFDRLRKNNAMIILASETVEHASSSAITHTIMQKIATQIFLPNPKATDTYKEVFGLTNKEFGLLNAMKVLNRHFLLKQGTDAIVGELNLINMDGLLAVLVGGDEGADNMEWAMEEAGNSPEQWLPLFYSKYDKARKR